MRRKAIQLTHIHQGLLDFSQVDLSIVSATGDDRLIRMETDFIHRALMAWQLVPESQNSESEPTHWNE
jgi:hypothetical protein